MNSSQKGVLIALSFIGVGSLAYLLFCKEYEEDEIRQIRSSQCHECKVRVPKSCCGMVIGRQGAKVKEIEAATGTKIHFLDHDDGSDFRICTIRGAPESCQTAEALIHEIILNQPLIETQDMKIPNEACGRLIGKNGTTIRNISFSSNAKIRVSRDGPVGGQRTVTIEGWYFNGDI